MDIEYERISSLEIAVLPNRILRRLISKTMKDSVNQQLKT
jgi:hypothetical protein